MSKRIDIKDDIYGDILVLDNLGHYKTHAIWKCLCMLCNETIVVSYTNLVSGNTHACGSCCKKYSYKKRWDIFNTLKRIQNVTVTAYIHSISRGLVYKINKELK